MQLDLQKTYRITKLEGKSQEEYPNSYWVQGNLGKIPEVGKSLFMWRFANSNYPNGRLGYFQTSVITSIALEGDFWTINTMNSKYRLEIVEEAEPVIGQANADT